jgi:hypothetical protein
MSVCRIVNLAYALVPLSAWRGFLIRRHVEKCARCQAVLAGRAESRALLASADGQKDGEHLWLKIRGQLGRGTASSSPFRRQADPRRAWKWALGLAALLAAVAVNFWVLRGVRSVEISAPALSPPDRFDLKYVRIEGENANAFVYQPQNSDMILVWAGKD